MWIVSFIFYFLGWAELIPKITGIYDFDRVIEEHNLIALLLHYGIWQSKFV